MFAINRRQFSNRCVIGALTTWAGLSGDASIGNQSALAEDEPRPVLGIGFSLYGCPKMSLADATALVDEVGFDSVELPLMAGWPGDPEMFSADSRTAFRDELAKRKLTCAALMEHLPLTVPEAQWPTQAERLRRAAAVARDLAPQAVPLVETVVGGKPGEWDKWRSVLIERLGEWARIANGEGFVLAVKPHVGSALDQPDFCRDLISSVDSKHVRLAFDFSHFVQRGFDMVETTRQLAPLSVFVHLKDRAVGEKTLRFVLPGEGAINTGELLKTLVTAGYRGPVVVEVSAQVHSQPGYSARTAAEKSYGHLTAAWDAAGLARPS